MFKHIWEYYNFYKMPKKIGDLIEHRGESLYIVGIEEINLNGVANRLDVLYTCQSLQADFQKVGSRQLSDWDLPIAWATLKTPFSSNYKQNPFKTIHPGRVVPIKEAFYKIVEYTDIEIKGTDIVIYFSVKELQAIRPKLAKTMMLESRKKLLGLQVYEGGAE
ncbi:hypothetical protein EauM23_00051 [Exiguobacterium phage vB_EauM-23]|nr:hypothetical protein EauM23_00051 [Exiguobacterium phage vB_EauM-23]